MGMVSAAEVQDRAAAYGLDVGSALAERLVAYLSLLLKWNTRINLTSVTGDGEAVDRLLLEGVKGAAVLGSAAVDVVDVGSGGGSPAIPLFLARGAGRLVLVEARQRKAAFLREAVRVLGLQGVRVAACRVAQLGDVPGLPGDVVTVRGVRLDAAMDSALAGVVKQRGKVLAFGGGVAGLGEGWEWEPPVALPGSGAGELFVGRRKDE